MGGSCNFAVKCVGATSSTRTSRGVGYNTENVSIDASQPHSRNFCNMNSALALSCADPTWFGSEAICSIQERCSAADRSESKRCSSCVWAATAPGEKPSRPPALGSASTLATPNATSIPASEFFNSRFLFTYAGASIQQCNGQCEHRNGCGYHDPIGQPEIDI